MCTKDTRDRVSIDTSIDTRSTLGRHISRHSVDSRSTYRSTVGRQSVDRLFIFADKPSSVDRN